MPKAVAIGEKNLILGFKGVGFEIIAVDTGAKLLPALNALTRDPEVALVLVTESIAAAAPEVIADFRERSQAILSVIPTHEGSRHTSFLEMRKAVERSLGLDILGKED